MDIRNHRRQIVALLSAASVAAATAAVLAAGPDDPESFSHYVAKDGAITRPADYREKFEHIGTSAVATKPGGPVDEMHSVYSRPEDVKAFRRDGKFPDGAVLVKEVTKVVSETLTAGEAHSLSCEQSREERGDRLQGRLQDMPHPGQARRLAVRPRLSRPQKMIFENPVYKERPSRREKPWEPSTRW